MKQLMSLTIAVICLYVTTGYAQNTPGRKDSIMKYHLYVANSSDEKILRYELDPETGDLTPVGEVAVEGGVGPLCTDPQQQYLYAGLRSTKKVSSFSIDPVSGALELINTVDLDGDPCYLSTDRTGRYLFSAYYGAGVIAVNALDSTGAVTTPHRQWIPTSGSIQSVRVRTAHHVTQCDFPVHLRRDKRRSDCQRNTQDQTAARRRSPALRIPPNPKCGLCFK